METANKQTLEEVIDDRLDAALNEYDEEKKKLAFEEAMKAIDRSIELTKLEDSKEENIKNNEIKLKESKKDRIIKCVEIGGALLIAPFIESFIKKGYAKIICNFEKDYTFTTSAGRGLSSLFRFKK